MPLTIKYATSSDGARTAFGVMGEGPPLVFTPGSVSHLEVFDETAEGREFASRLAERHRLVMYDRHGCGRSRPHGLLIRRRRARPGSGDRCSRYRPDPHGRLLCRRSARDHLRRTESGARRAHSLLRHRGGRSPAHRRGTVDEDGRQSARASALGHGFKSTLRRDDRCIRGQRRIAPTRRTVRSLPAHRRDR